MKLRRNLILILIVAIVACIAILGWSYVSSRQAQRMTVVAAKIDIPQGLAISAEMLGAVEVRKPDPGEAVAVAYVLDPKQIEGKVALQTFLAGQPIDGRGVGTEPPPGRPMTSGEIIPPGERGVPVSVDQLLSVAGAAKAGDTLTIYYGQEDWEAIQLWLDNVAALKPAGSGSTVGVPPVVPSAGGGAAAEQIVPQITLAMETIPLKWDILFQHVLLLDLRKGAPGGGDSLVRSDAKAGDQGATYMVLDLTDEQAKTLLYYLQLGRVRFALEGENNGQ